MSPPEDRKRKHEGVEENGQDDGSKQTKTAQPDVSMQHPSTRPPTSIGTSAFVNGSFMRLPRKVHAHILKNVTLHDQTIIMKDGKALWQQRRWTTTDIKQLKDPGFKRSKQSMYPTYMLTCRGMYHSGVEMFWGENTFSFFELSELQRFIDTATTAAKQSIKSIKLFEGYTALPNGPGP